MKRLRLQARHLYLLALFQLVVGPLVLVQVTTFCTLAVREIPQHGMATAMVKAWHNDQFQSLLDASTEVRLAASESSPLRASTKARPDVIKITLIAWQPASAVPVRPAKPGAWTTHAEAWTPVSPHAPPGPPPRLG